MCVSYGPVKDKVNWVPKMPRSGLYCLPKIECFYAREIIVALGKGRGGENN